jgi:hypothetical protein
MDSMRSLNTSLPTAYTSRPVPPEQLLQAFRSAALSVTNLYKSAVQDQNNNRAAGYQDALDDLLRFLDSENLGVQDGEGWRIRQWATERYDRTANQAQDESEDETKSEPVQQREPASVEPVVENASQDADAMQNVERLEPESERATSAQPESTSTFKFSYPSETSTMLAERGLGIQTQPPTSSPVSEPELPSAPIHAMSRSGRGSRPHSHRLRGSNRTPFTITGKRKNPWPDVNFFDLGNMGPKDPGPDGGNKRGRFA